MTIEPAASFYGPWIVALAAASAEPKIVVLTAPILQIAGIDLPVVQLVLAIAGVLMARPLARKREVELSFMNFAIVTVAMIVVAVAWVAESKPGVLFTFVVAIGLGFSGYSLIETAGGEIQAFITRILSQAADAISFRGDRK